MCNINIIIKTEQKKNNSLLCSLINVTTNSFIHNSDGDGYFFSDSKKVYKSNDKINLLDYQNDIYKSNFILSHQRFTTSGFNNKFIQPFKNKDFVLMHNGVLNSFENKKNKNSDTYNLFNEFYKVFKKQKDTNRQKNIINSIKNIFDNLNGSFSIAIFDIKTNNLYYFKNDKTNINLIRSNDLFYLTTNKDNIDLFKLYQKNITFNIQELKDYTIYKILIDKNKIKLFSIGEIKPEQKKTYSIKKEFKNYCKTDKPYFSYYDNNKITNNSNNLYMDLEFFKASRSIYKIKNKVRCDYCNKKTKNESNYKEHICNNCLIKEMREINKDYHNYLSYV